MENIASALGVLKDELDKLPSLKEVIPDGKFSRTRNAEIISFNSKRPALEHEFRLLIDALVRELRRLKKKFQCKKQKLARGVKRNDRKRKGRVITEGIKCVDRFDITSNVTELSSFSSSDLVKGHISSIDLVELIIDSGLLTPLFRPYEP